MESTALPDGLPLWRGVERATPGDIMEIEEISAESDYKEPGSSGTQANSGEAEFKQTELRPEPPGKGLLG